MQKDSRLGWGKTHKTRHYDHQLTFMLPITQLNNKKTTDCEIF